MSADDAEPLRDIAERGIAGAAIDVDVDELHEHLQRLHPGISAAAAQGLHATDLALAFACSRGDAEALSRFEAEYGPDVDKLAASRVRDDSEAADIAQKVRLKILFPPSADGSKGAAIRNFTGRGSLRAWVRVVASRAVLDQYRDSQSRTEQPADPTIFDAFEALETDPRALWLRERYRTTVEEAMTAAFEALSSRERRLLRGLLLQRMSTDALGARHGVHRTTAARWVEAARVRLVERTHEELAARLGTVSSETAASLIALIRSTVQVSVARLLSSGDS